MKFNRGWLCGTCGPIPKAKTSNINKIPHNLCPKCSTIVNEWERPLTERSGRCACCGHAHFELRMHKSQLLRRCRNCNEVYNIDTEKIIRKGVIEDEHDS